jgi:hypothetical protein
MIENDFSLLFPVEDGFNLLDSSVIFATLLTPRFSGENESGLAGPFFVCGADSLWI